MARILSTSLQWAFSHRPKARAKVAVDFGVTNAAGECVYQARPDLIDDARWRIATAANREAETAIQRR